MAEMGDSLTDVGGINEARAEVLREAGFETVTDLQGASEAQLEDVDGIRDALAARIKADVGDLPDVDPPSWLSPLSDRIDPGIARAIDDAGYTSIGMLAAADVEELQTVDGIGESVAEEVLAAVDEWVDDPSTEAANTPPDAIRGVDEDERAALADAGFHSVADLQGATPAQIAAVDGIDDALAGWMATEAGSLPVAGVQLSEDLAALIVAEGVTPGAVAALSRTGYRTTEDVGAASVSRLTDISGIARPVAEAIVAAARER